MNCIGPTTFIDNDALLGGGPEALQDDFLSSEVEIPWDSKAFRS